MIVHRASQSEILAQFSHTVAFNTVPNFISYIINLVPRINTTLLTHRTSCLNHSGLQFNSCAQLADLIAAIRFALTTSGTMKMIS